MEHIILTECTIARFEQVYALNSYALEEFPAKTSEVGPGTKAAWNNKTSIAILQHAGCKSHEESVDVRVSTQHTLSGLATQIFSVDLKVGRISDNMLIIAMTNGYIKQSRSHKLERIQNEISVIQVQANVDIIVCRSKCGFIQSLLRRIKQIAVKFKTVYLNLDWMRFINHLIDKRAE